MSLNIKMKKIAVIKLDPNEAVVVILKPKSVIFSPQASNDDGATSLLPNKSWVKPLVGD